MAKRIIIFLPLLCLALSAYTQVNKIDSIVREEMSKQHIAGLSLGIMKDGHLMLSKGYGFADVKDSVPATENTVYKIGSLSKQFIATAIVVLAEEGKLSLSDPIRKYFKDAPDAWKNITVRNLLNHTSGLERESPLSSLTVQRPDSVVVRASYYDSLLFAPGTKWQYSNLGYFVLADIIRQASSRRFEEYMNEQFATYGLENTVTVNKSKGNKKAKGYNYNYETDINHELPDYTVLRPSGAFSSNIPDLLKWDSLQRENKVLSSKAWTKMWEDTVLVTGSSITVYYGYGWFVREQNGHRLVYHGGNPTGGGYTSDFWKFIDDKISIVLLTNATEAHLDKIAYKISAVVDSAYKVTHPVIANIDEYTGIYYNAELKMKISITNDDGELTAQATGQSSFSIKNTTTDIFKNSAVGVELDFNTTEKKMTLKQHGLTYVFSKEK